MAWSTINPWKDQFRLNSHFDAIFSNEVVSNHLDILTRIEYSESNFCSTVEYSNLFPGNLRTNPAWQLCSVYDVVCFDDRFLIVFF